MSGTKWILYQALQCSYNISRMQRTKLLLHDSHPNQNCTKGCQPGKNLNLFFQKYLANNYQNFLSNCKVTMLTLTSLEQNLVHYQQHKRFLRIPFVKIKANLHNNFIKELQKWSGVNRSVKKNTIFLATFRNNRYF